MNGTSFNKIFTNKPKFRSLWLWEGENCRAQYNKKILDEWTEECGNYDYAWQLAPVCISCSILFSQSKWQENWLYDFLNIIDGLLLESRYQLLPFFFPPFLRKNWTIFDHLQRANSTNLQLKTFFPPKIFHWEQLFFAITLSSLILTLSNKNTNILLHGKIISPKVKQKLLVIICKSKLWLHIP